jgi:limonene-1,2-epoxide hydrolase
MTDVERLVRDMFANLFTAPERYFGPQAEFFPWGPGHPPVIGPEEMKKAITEIITPLSDIEFEFISFASTGNKVFADRIDRFTVSGHRVTLPVVGVGVLGSDGKFLSWMDYFDLMPFRRFNLGPSRVGGVRER